MAKFDYFIVFAEMRTGSNLLEACLNEVDGLSCHGELFNPHFIGGPRKTKVFGMTKDTRDADPAALLMAMVNGRKDTPGFRYFHDHDPRVLDIVMDDRRCAKVVLTRDPLDAFVSRKIAAATDQWRLGKAKDRKSASIRFDMVEFEAYLDKRSAFQAELRNRLQLAGQSAFILTYEDIQDIDVLTGLFAYLGAPSQLKALPRNIVRQNPEPLAKKVENFDEMQKSLAGFEWLDLKNAPSFEPKRGPVVPTYVTAAHSPIIYLPVQGGPADAVQSWLQRLDGATTQTGHTQKSLREWLSLHPSHRSFTVVRHPMLRAFSVFRSCILDREGKEFSGVRNYLENQLGLEVSQSPPTPEQLSALFAGYLEFVWRNLAGQTPVRTDRLWASQAALIAGFGEFLPPDQIMREDEVASRLAGLASDLGLKPQPIRLDSAGDALTAIHTDKLEKLSRRAYRRDYLTFGFGDWSGD